MEQFKIAFTGNKEQDCKKFNEVLNNCFDRFNAKLDNNNLLIIFDWLIEFNQMAPLSYFDKKTLYNYYNFVIKVRQQFKAALSPILTKINTELEKRNKTPNYEDMSKEELIALLKAQNK